MVHFINCVLSDIGLLIGLSFFCWTCPLTSVFNKVAFICLMIAGVCAMVMTINDCGGYYNGVLSMILTFIIFVMMIPYWRIRVRYFRGLEDA